ncbi:glycosyl transferase [Histomonas meleagridis]|uniref:glycosyl transferase n=1 Tax=Histomonas meleagridis TaxID=135588 RepID=UPI003559F743|nr:glycosyl transferase [Histomonas meleagridis]KAH0800372.1 glycosyl transferase [Histomonas meleagridis]
MDPDKLAEYIGYFLIILLVISFIFVLFDRFVSDQTLYDIIQLPPKDPRHITYYIEPISDPTNPVPFPSVFSQPEVYVTFVVPAYNEEKRLPSMLDDTVDYLLSRQSADPNFTWEIIIVDDGSKDRTADFVLSYSLNHPEVRLLRQPRNMGKGAAVQAGCLHARGKMILMVDADGATKISEFGVLEQKLLQLQNYNPMVVVVGSRAHLDGENKANRTALRDFLGKSFHFLIWLSGVRGIKDTQCGFKLFSREAAQWLFPNQHIQRWCFDPELLVIARKKRMEISEIPVEWNEIDGSKMKFLSMIKMALDLLQIAVFYPFKIWNVKMRGNIQYE